MTYENSRNVVKTTSGVDLLAGLWLFISPWILGFYSRPSDLNSWIAGAAVFLFAAVQLGTPDGTRVWSLFNTILGVWIFISPWVYGYQHDMPRFVNSLCVGVIVFALSAYSSRGMGRMTPGTPVHP